MKVKVRRKRTNLEQIAEIIITDDDPDRELTDSEMRLLQAYLAENELAKKSK